MEFEDIKKMTAEELVKRLADIETEMEDDDADIDELSAEVDAINERKAALLEAAEKRNALAAKVASGAVGQVKEEFKGEEPKMTLNEIRASHEYNVAYAEYIKTGDDTECRSLLTDIADGTVPVPTMIQDEIEKAWEAAVLVSRTRKVNVKGLLKVPYEKSATAASVHTEGADAPAEEELVLDSITLTPEMLKKWITISDEVYAMKGEAFLNYINAEITQRIAELADSKLVEAIKASALANAATAAADFTGILSGLATLSSNATKPVVICSKNLFFNKFMAATDTTGRPIYNVIPENGKPVYMLHGCEVLFTETLDDTSYIVGDLDGALVNLPEGDGVKFVTDPYSLAEKDLIKVVGRLYAAFGVVRPNYFTVVTVG